MPKYTKEFKMKLVLEYLSVQSGGREMVAKKYDELVNEIEKYIKWYNEDRIKTKLNGMSPVMYRLHSA